MARRIPSDRFDALLRAATEVFIELGYRRTQMSDIAERLGVAKGTVYLYVESKEALFLQVLLHADRADDVELPEKLPVPTPKPGEALRFAARRLAAGAELPALAAACGRRAAPDVRAELESILRELFDVLAANRTGIKLLDRCAHDYPELAEIWFGAGRSGVVRQLERYLAARIRQERLPAVADVPLAARMVLETTVLWAVHRHWDPAPQPIDDELARTAVVQFLSRALLGG